MSTQAERFQGDLDAGVPSAVVAQMAKATRGTTNRNDGGSSYSRRVRREWLIETYRADVDVIRVVWPSGETSLIYPTDRALAVQWAAIDQETDAAVENLPACRCYRCGVLLHEGTVTVDRIIPGCKGGTYRRNNIRPACGTCNSETGGALASHATKGGRS
jgi:5-methylcytosine-specific restriction endonuclease McrA